MTQLEIPGMEKPKHAVVSLSGGMDSSTLLLKCLDKFETVTALSFDYGQKHKVELKRARALVDYLKRNGHNVTYQSIKLDGLVELLDSALVEGGADVPEGHYEQDNMKETVVPNRNKIFSSIIQAVALSIANKTSSPVKIAMGIHAGDHAIYPDYKSASSVERIEAFIKLGRPDPVQYADETGPVDYEIAQSYVEQVLENYEG